MSSPGSAWRLRSGPRSGYRALVELAAIAALMLSTPTRAAVFDEVVGTANAATVSGPAPGEFYGPGTSTAGGVASASAADQISLLQTSATSQAFGIVTSTTEGHATFGSSFGNSLAAWNGVFTNTDTAGAEFLLTVAWARDFAVQAERPIDVFVPPDFPGNVEPHADATLTSLLSFGATQISFDALASDTYQFNVGFIGAGASLALQMSVSTSANIDAGSIYTCTTIDPGPDDCTFRPGVAHAFSEGTLVISDVSPVPEPSQALLLLAGLAILGSLMRRRGTGNDVRG